MIDWDDVSKKKLNPEKILQLTHKFAMQDPVNRALWRLMRQAADDGTIRARDAKAAFAMGALINIIHDNALGIGYSRVQFSFSDHDQNDCIQIASDPDCKSTTYTFYVKGFRNKINKKIKHYQGVDLIRFDPDSYVKLETIRPNKHTSILMAAVGIVRRAFRGQGIPEDAFDMFCNIPDENCIRHTNALQLKAAAEMIRREKITQEQFDQELITRFAGCVCYYLFGGVSILDLAKIAALRPWDVDFYPAKG